MKITGVASRAAITTEGWFLPYKGQRHNKGPLHGPADKQQEHVDSLDESEPSDLLQGIVKVHPHGNG